MKISYTVIIILLIFTTILTQENNNSSNITREFWNSSGDKLISYIGVSGHGNGRFYHGDLSDSLLIYEGYLRYGPICNWITNSIAEINIPTGSPNFHAFYYNHSKKILSNPYSLGIAVDTLNQTIACLAMNKIQFYDIFSDSIFLEYNIDGLEPIGFLVFCRPTAFFDKLGDFHLQYECRGKQTMPIQNMIDEITVFLYK